MEKTPCLHNGEDEGGKTKGARKVNFWTIVGKHVFSYLRSSRRKKRRTDKAPDVQIPNRKRRVGYKD